MGEIVKYEQVKDKIIVLRGEPVLLDADVAALYGVETKRVNEAVKNNPDKFPENYTYKLDSQEVADLWSKNSTSSWGENNSLNSINSRTEKIFESFLAFLDRQEKKLSMFIALE